MDIRDTLKEKYNLDTTIKHDEIIGDNGLIKIRIEPPCKTPDCREEQKKWLLRMAPSASFDRWSVSAAIEERFDNPDRIVEFLCHVAMIYKKLFDSLSNDYMALNKENEMLTYGEADEVEHDSDDWTYETGNGCWSTCGFSATKRVIVNSKSEVFRIQKDAGYNYIARYKGNGDVRHFWNPYIEAWVDAAIYID